MPSLPIDQVRIGDRLRKTDPERVRAIGESIAEIGLQTPISVAESERWEDGRKLPCFDLVTGLHRLMACRALGHQEIAATVVDLDEIDRQIWECDENLARANLTPAAEARFLARRKELYEIKHPQTRHGVAGAEAKHRGADDNLSFASDTATKTGESERTIQRAVRRGEKIADDVLDKIEGTANDKGVVLDRLAKMEPKKQREAVKRLEQGKPLPAPKPKPKPQPETSPEPDHDTVGLAALKRAWLAATEADQAAFQAWLIQTKGDLA